MGLSLPREASGALTALSQNAGSWLGKMRPPVSRASVLSRLMLCMARVGSHTTPGGISSSIERCQ